MMHGDDMSTLGLFDGLKVDTLQSRLSPYGRKGSAAQSLGHMDEDWPHPVLGSQTNQLHLLQRGVTEERT
jgi:hypothetical protein